MSDEKTSARDRAVKGLLSRIEWMVLNNRPREEIAKTVERLGALCDKYVREDSLESFWQELGELGEAEH